MFENLFHYLEENGTVVLGSFF